MDERRKAEDKGVKSTRDVLKKWNDYYINNNFGIGIQCDKCQKWREVFQYEDQSEVPEVWICSMWKMDGHRRGSCRIPSDLNEDHFAAALYSPGSLVWAKCPGYPWWPAMIEDCPDVQHYFMPYVDSEHEYHVNFFGKKPLRNWIKASCIRDFSTPPPMTPKAKKSKDLQRSIEQANEALKISPKERLKKYSFAVRYKGRWAKVKQFDKVALPPSCLKRRIKEEPSNSGSQLLSKEPHANRNCDRSPTVRKVIKGKSEIATKRKSVDNERFQSAEPKKNESSSEKEENGEDSSEFRSQLQPEAPHANQDCRSKSTVRKLKNVKSKLKAATNRKSVEEEEFQPVLLSVGAINGSSSDSEKEENGEENSSEFRPDAEAPHVNQDCYSKSIVSNRKSGKEEKLLPVPQSVGTINESSSDSESGEDSSEFRSQVMTKEPHFHQDCPTTLTVWEIRKAKSNSKTVTNKESVNKEKFQQSSKHKGSVCSKNSDKEENSDVEDLFETRPQVKQVCPRKLTVWEIRNAESKLTAASNQKSVDKKRFQPVLQAVKATSESSSDSEIEENPSEFRWHVKGKEQHLNQDCPRTLTVWEVRNGISIPEDATKRKSVGKKEFQPSSKHKRRENPENSDEDENSELEDFSETRSPVTAESTACPDGPRMSTVGVVVGKSEDTNKRKLGDEGFQSVKHKRSECSTDSEKDESEEDNSTSHSDSEEEESPEIKTYAEYWKKKYQIPDSKLLSADGTGGNCSYRNSDSAIHYKHENNFSENGSIICRENAAEFLENDTVIHNGNYVENSQSESGANVLDTDASLFRIQHPYSSVAKYEQFCDRSERIKKNRERIRRLINSNNSKYMPYSFYRGRMKN